MMLAEYIPVVILGVIALHVPAVIILLSFILGPQRPSERKSMKVECGVPTSGDAHSRVPVRYYRVGLLYLLFDVEVAFLYPWALVYQEVGVAGFIRISLFVLILLLGFAYAWREGGLQWE